MEAPLIWLLVSHLYLLLYIAYSYPLLIILLNYFSYLFSAVPFIYPYINNLSVKCILKIYVILLLGI